MNLMRFLAIFLFLSASVMAPAQAVDSGVPIIGITEIKAPVDDRYWRSRVNVKADNFQVMLETQMSKVGRFKIIERNRVNEILSEQGLNNSFGDGRTANGGFHIAGVDYLVYGAITDFSQSKKTLGTNKFKSEKISTQMSVDIKIVDAQTGEIRLAETVTEILETGNSLNTSNFSNSKKNPAPLTQIQRVVAKKLAGVIATTIFPIEVIKTSRETIYINYGDAILNKGDTLAIFRLGEKLIDQSTGLDLGAEEEEVALLEIFEVTKKFSKAKLLKGEVPAVGNIARVHASNANHTGTRPQEKRGRKI